MVQQVLEASNIRALGQRVRLSIEDRSLELVAVPDEELPQGWKVDMIGSYLREGMYYVFILIFVSNYFIFIAMSFNNNSNYIYIYIYN
jgi:hypothetical protein